jgi:hypothetical protein
VIDGAARDGVRPRARLDRRGVILIAALFAAALLFSRSCQQGQVRVTQRQAVTAAQRQIDFTPRQTQVRLVRQGLTAHPYWAVSLSVPGSNGGFKRLTTVRVDANTGKVVAVNREVPAG